MPSVDHDGVERTSGERDGESFFRLTVLGVLGIVMSKKKE